MTKEEIAKARDQREKALYNGDDDEMWLLAQDVLPKALDEIERLQIELASLIQELLKLRPPEHITITGTIK